MKVYLGPYRNKIISEVHGNYMHKKYGYYEWDENQTVFEMFLEGLEGFLDKLYNLTINKVRSTERITKVKLDPWDCWDMDHTLSFIVLPMLRKIKVAKHGVPLVDDVDVPVEIRNSHLKDYLNCWHMDEKSEDYKNCVENFKLMEKKWEYVLNEMIWAFAYFEYETTVEESQLPTSVILKNLDRQANGLRLFGTYFRSLSS